MAILPLMRDLHGNMIHPGRINKTISADFMFDSALPSWLSVTSGTLTNVLGLDASAGRPLITSDATSGSAATLAMVPGIDISRVESIQWTAQGFVTNDVGTGIDLIVGLRNTANTAGLFFTQAGGSTNGLRCKYAGDSGTGQGSDSANVINLGEGNRNKDFSILLYPKLKMAYYLEGDQVNGAWEVPSLVTGVINPTLGISTKSATAKSFRVHRVSLAVTVN